MAEQRQFSLQTVIHTNIHGVDCEVSILADTACELQGIISELTKGGGEPQPQQTQQTAQDTPSPAATQANPTQAAGPTPSGPTAANAASPTPQAAPAPDTTSAPAPAASEQALTLNDVLAPARQLLQNPGGEDTLRQILGQFGAQAISQADPAHYAGIKQAIEQNLGQ